MCEGSEYFSQPSLMAPSWVWYSWKEVSKSSSNLRRVVEKNIQPALDVSWASWIPEDVSHSWTDERDSGDGANSDWTWAGVQCLP